VVLNAANEIAVAAFLEKKILFADIPAVVAGHGRPPGAPGGVRRGHHRSRKDAGAGPPRDHAEVNMGNFLGTF